MRADYGMPAANLDFLPLGADANTAVYRAVTGQGTLCFVKLRSGSFDELVEQGDESGPPAGSETDRPFLCVFVADIPNRTRRRSYPSLTKATAH